MSDIFDRDSDMEGSGNDITNNNYMVHDGECVQHLNNVTLPCILFLENDDGQTLSQRRFHIEISEENYSDQGQVIPFRCHTFPPEQGFGMVTHRHIKHAIEAHQGTDVQKMRYMINCVKEFEEILYCFAFDNDKLHKRFEDAETKLHSEIAELTRGVGKINEVVGKVYEATEKYSRANIKGFNETTAQTDDHSSPPSQNDIRAQLSPSTYSFQQISRDDPENKKEDIDEDLKDDLDKKTCSGYSDAVGYTENLKIKDTADVLDTSPHQGNNSRSEEMTTTVENEIKVSTRKAQSDIVSSVQDWTIDKDNWSECIDQKDHHRMKKLLNEKMLPCQMLLDKACCIFGRSSAFISDVCQEICKYLQQKASANLIDIWPAYLYDKSAKHENEEITFIAIVSDQCELGIGDEYRIYKRQASICSLESKEINRLEFESEEFEDSSAVTSCLNENSATLMRNHSKLSMVSASCMVSKGYTNNKPKEILNKQCITLYVHIKGYIPLKEKPFPEKVGNYPVDVREAVFMHYYGGRPNEYHEHLRMGCAITTRMVNEQGHFLSGTLGGFVEHPLHGLCCITCAHILGHDLNRFSNSKTIQWIDQGTYVPVFQPSYDGSPSFGHVIGAVYNPGGLGDSGVEVALIKIDTRAPIDGLFPDTSKNQQAGFSDDKPMAYCDGRICELEKLNKGSVVIKYGCSTEITRGVFRLQGGAVRTGHHSGNNAGADFLLLNQIEILSAGEDIFAMYGDSGAFVFMQENDQLSLIGMFEGGLNDGRFIVTPIRDILKALDLPMKGTLKTFENIPVLQSPLSDHHLNPNVSFRCSIPRPFSVSRNDSAISISTSVSDDSSSQAVITLVDDKLKVANDKISQELTKHVSEIKTEITENMDVKLDAIKMDLKREIQISIEQSIQQQTEIIKQFLGAFDIPRK